MTVRILVADCRDAMRSLPAGSVHCVVTSPPYFGLRDYGVDGQIGLEPTPAEFVEALVLVFREVRRVLRDDGTVWLNLGDSYARQGGTTDTTADKRSRSLAHMHEAQRRGTEPPDGLKHKDLIGIPWRVAFALQADGWFLRSDIIWHKPNPMPESVTDRPTKSHEYLFLLTKSERYFYDADAIREPHSEVSLARVKRPLNLSEHVEGRAVNMPEGGGDMSRFCHPNGRNARTVWTIATSPFKGAHFATFPPELPEKCISAGTSEHGACRTCGAPWERNVERTPMVIDRSERTHSKGQTRASGTMVEPAKAVMLGWVPTCECADNAPVPCVVLDPFGGAGTTALVAERLQRDAILCELNPEYAEIARARIAAEAPMFAAVTVESVTPEPANDNRPPAAAEGAA